jgi:hypothetical protein
VADTGSDITFIRVHENEMPAGSVGTRINTEIPSRYIDLSQRAHREVTFTLTGQQYSFDPNRIYSVDVAPGTRGAGVAPAAAHPTSALARVITRFLLPNAAVIALHNNKGTLLESYASGPFMKFTNRVYINPRMAASTFAVVSTEALFDAIKHLGISVVWEDRAGSNDDGSLLAYAQRNDIPYVNIEAAQGASIEAQLGIVRQIVPILSAQGETRGARWSQARSDSARRTAIPACVGLPSGAAGLGPGAGRGPVEALNQQPRIAQVWRIEPFGEPPVDVAEEPTRVRDLPLTLA